MNATSTASPSVPKTSAGEWLQRQLMVGLGRLPASVLKRLVKVPVNGDGETMAPEVALLMAAVAKAPDFSDLSPAGAREAELKDATIFGERPLPMATVENLELPGGLAATRYRPASSSRGLVVFFHGGGFVLGSRATYDGPLRLLAHHANADVLSVEYRLAPEHPFPAPLEDAKVAWEYAVAHAPGWGIPVDRIVIAGDSAGANIAAVMAQELRESGHQPAAQVLVYPVTDVSATRPSHDEFKDSPALTAKQISWFVDHYVPAREDRTDPRVSPLLAKDLTGLPPAIVTVGGFDPLRDDGLAYTDRLKKASVPAELIREPGLVHGYLGLTALSPTSRDATVRVAQAISHAIA